MKSERSAAGLAGELEVGHAARRLLEHDLDLEPGQVGAEAEVDAAAAEGDVVVRRAADVERVRVVEHVVVAVAGQVVDDDLVALP